MWLPVLQLALLSGVSALAGWHIAHGNAWAAACTIIGAAFCALGAFVGVFNAGCDYQRRLAVDAARAQGFDVVEVAE